MGSSRQIAESYGRGAVLDIMFNANYPSLYPYGTAFFSRANEYVLNNNIDSDQPSIDYTNYLRQPGYDAVEIQALQYFIAYETPQVVLQA